MKHLPPAIILALFLYTPALGHDAEQHRTDEPESKAYILRSGMGEALFNGLVVKASPRSGTEGAILVEQTFRRGEGTSLHVHDQGDELFYVVAGRGEATLGKHDAPIAAGDVIFAPRGAVHAIRNEAGEVPLVVVFFMDSPELVRQFRAVHERRQAHPDTPLTPEEMAEIEHIFGGAREVGRR